MSKIRLGLLGLVLLGTAGCSAWPSAPTASTGACDEVPAPEHAGLSFTLTTGPATIATDDEAPHGHQLRIAGDDDLLARALLLALRGTPDDEAEARRLLAPRLTAGHEAAETPRARLARMLDARLLERQQLRATLAEERQERELLQKQLDELMNIEQQINRRMQGPAVEVPSS